MLNYLPLSNFKEDLLYNLLSNSYKDLINNYKIPRINNLINGWKQFDNEAFNNEKIGKHVLVSCINNKPIGFFSYDPRQKPTGIIGHNCILPKYRKKGYGKQQINKLLKILALEGFNTIKVTTGDHPFFISAQKMYLALGFKEIKRYKDEKIDYPVIEYKKDFS